MTHIAKADNDAMNFLYSQLTKTATPVDSIATDQAISDHAEQDKVVKEVLKGDAKELKDVKTAAAKDEMTEQAFKDHEEYLDVLESILSDDKKETFDPNDVTKD